MADTLKNKGSTRESNRGVENSLKFISNKQRLLMLILIVILIISPLMLNLIDDAGAHIARIEYLQDNIQNLGIFGAMHSKVYFGMVRNAGYGYPMFYGDILLYPFAILLSLQKALGFDRQVGLDAYTIYKIFLSVQFLCVFLSAYLQAKKFFKYHMSQVEMPYNINIQDLQMLIGFLYVMMPYNVMNLHNQAYRIAATALLPWVIYNAFEIYLQTGKNSKTDKRSVKRNVIWLQITMTLVIMTHVISAVYVQVVLIIFIIYEVIMNRELNIRAIKRYLIAAGITILLSSFLIFPMFMALKSGIYAVSNSQYDLAGTYNTTLIGLFVPEWIYVLIAQLIGIPETEQLHYGAVGYYGFYYQLLLIYGIYAAFSGMLSDETDQTIREDNKAEKAELGTICIIYQVIYLIFNYTGIAQELIEFTQFRYRLNTIFDFGLIYLIIKILLYNLGAKPIDGIDNFAGYNKYRKTDYGMESDREYNNIGLSDTVADIDKYNRNRQIILNILICIAVITVQLSLFYSQVLNIGRVELGLQVGGGGEYLVYNDLYNNMETTSEYALHYGTAEQINDIADYIDQFKTSENIEIKDVGNAINTREYEISNISQTIQELNNTLDYIEENRQNLQGRKVQEIQNRQKNSLALPIIYYPGYKIEILSFDDIKGVETLVTGYKAVDNDIETVNSDVETVDNDVEAVDNDIETNVVVNNLGFIQLNLSDELLNNQKIEVNVKYTGTTLDNITFIIQLIAWIAVAIAVIWIEVDKRNK